jgi:hypothetical protein
MAKVIIKDNAQNGAVIDIALPKTEKSTGPGYRDFEIMTDEKIELAYIIVYRMLVLV